MPAQDAAAASPGLVPRALDNDRPDALAESRNEHPYRIARRMRMARGGDHPIPTGQLADRRQASPRAGAFPASLASPITAAPARIIHRAPQPSINSPPATLNTAPMP
ncbi:MAG: hypothetical protein OXC15_19500 [Rhodospirillaceae bacterium]|nr:hypothetical protein [Rhodospirillaceae bacterium]